MRSAGSIQDIKWRDVRVGHILKVEDEELFPADLLCLYSALEDDACFIKTTNLDGESNLKIRRPLDLRDAAPEEDADVLDIHATLECEQPNANLHKFQGRLIYQSGGEGECPPVLTWSTCVSACKPGSVASQRPSASMSCWLSTRQSCNSLMCI